MICLFIGRHLIFAYVPSHDHLRFSTLQILHSTLHTPVVKPHPVDERFVFLQAKQPWPGIAGLSLGRYRADFNKAKTQCRKFIDIFCVFVKPCSQPHGVFKFYTENFPFKAFVLIIE